MSFLFILKLSYSKPSPNTLNYASTANIEEVMNFYNLGDKTFETDFSYHRLPSGSKKTFRRFHLRTNKITFFQSGCLELQKFPQVIIIPMGSN